VTQHQGYIESTPAEIDSLDRLLETVQGSPLFADFHAPIKDLGKGKLTTPYKSAMKRMKRSFEDEAQGTGDCTSHGTRNCCDIARAVDIDILLQPEKWLARGCTEHIYGARGHSGQGMSPSIATQFMVKYGVLGRGKYGSYNLSKYNWPLGAGWGGRTIPTEILNAAKTQPAEYWARAKSTAEIRDALAGGMAAHGGSQFGTRGVRGKNGICNWDDSWNHDMAIGACDDTRTLDAEALFLIINSWGIWNSGPMPEWGPIPGGSMVVRESTLARMIATGEFFIMGNVDGYDADELPDYGSGSYI